ncbi:transcriptional regulator [Rosenbergiella epipactidis]|uniref:transcriptional regulator n=1 Tax=Rosenbergiella epipactidis TaxID=1544694 RepID=UPI001F4F55A5|nr:YdaS family helix-turn-helix protein [Rosenbergiella epipactidis]
MTTELSALKEAIALAGSQSELARRISKLTCTNVKQQQVWNWVNRSQKTPSKHVIPIESVTGVSRSKLRPDLYPS